MVELITSRGLRTIDERIALRHFRSSVVVNWFEELLERLGN